MGIALIIWLRKGEYEYNQLGKGSQVVAKALTPYRAECAGLPMEAHGSNFTNAMVRFGERRQL